MKITISRAAFIAAAATIQAKDDVRYYLKGVLIEKGPDDKPLIVATDGHRMVAIQDQNGLLPDEMNPVIISFGPDTLRAAKLVKNLELPVFIEILEPLDADGCEKVQVSIGSTTTSDSEVIMGSFPEWRRVASDTKGTAAGWYNSAYVADFHKIAKYLNRGCPAVTIRSDAPNSSAAVYFGGVDYAFGVIMPMRTDKMVSITSLPAWTALPVKKAA